MTNRRAAQIDEIVGEDLGSIAPGSWPKPAAVDPVDGWLVPTWSDEAAPSVVARSGILREFLELSARDSEHRCLAFARDHGMLGLSRLAGPAADPATSADVLLAGDLQADEEPTSGSRRGARRRRAAALLAVSQLGAPDPWAGEAGPEAVADWRALARRAQTAVLLAHRARDPRRRSPFGAGWWLSLEIDWWMHLGDVRPRLAWREDGPSVSLGSGTLLGELAVRLLHAVAGGGGLLMMCADCGEWVAAKRRPSPGMAYRCVGCRGAATAKRYRDRNREDPNRPKLGRGRGALIADRSG